MRARNLQRDECGVALLAVLIVITVLTIAVVEFTYSVTLDRHRARNSLDQLQSTLLARSGINMAQSFLVKDEEPKFDSPAEDWWKDLLDFCREVPLIDQTQRIRCQIEDESGKININLSRVTAGRRVSEEQAVTRDAIVRDAIRSVLLAQNMSSGDVQEIMNKLIEYWTQEPTPDRNGQTPRVPDFKSVEDFAATFAIPTSKLPRLRRFLTAQPGARTINVNTASPRVLNHVLCGGYVGEECPYTEAVAAIVEKARSEEPFQSAGEVQQILGEHQVEHKAQLNTLFGVQSRLFRLRATGITNLDPEDENSGGIAQTLTVLVERRSGVPLPGKEGPGWTLKPLDWQKEAGAALMEETTEIDESRDERDDEREEAEE